MKNFTKQNFKQFTSRLSARWLIMTLMLLLGTSSAWGANLASGQVIQFKFSQGSVSQSSGWNGTVLNMWDNNGNSKQVNVQPGEVYTISEGHWIPTKFQYLSQYDYSGWKGKTAEIGDCGGKASLQPNTCYFVTLKTSTNWTGTQYQNYPNKEFQHSLSCTTVDPCETTYYVASGTLPGASWDADKHLVMNTCEGGLRSLTFNGVAAGDYEFKITQGNWNWSTGSYHTDKGNLTCSSGSDGNIKISTNNLGVTNITIYFDGTKAYASYAAACTPPTITLSNKEVTYNGSAQKPTFNGVTPTKVTYNDTELANGPTDAGTYTVKVWANASGDFCEVVGVELTDKFIIKQKAPSAGDFTYTASKPYIGSAVSADVTWTQGTGTGTITTYYKVKGAADNTYTTTAPTNAGTYTVAVTTVPGGNYAAATNKIELDDFFEITKINQTTELKISNQQKELCESSVTLTTSGGSGTGAVSYALSDNTAGATISNNNQLTAARSGSVTVVATKAADNNYNAATSKGVTFTFNLLSAPTFSESTRFVCENESFNLNTKFSRNNGNNGTLEWYEEDDTKVPDPTNVSISKTTKYYAKLKDGSCYSEESSLVTAKINTPAISDVVITKESPTSISVTATITGEDLALGLVEYVFDERGMDWSFASSNRGAVVDNKYSCTINNLIEGRAYKIRVGANTGTCDGIFAYSNEYQITTDCATYPAPAITTSDIVCPNTNVTLSDYNNGVANVLWYSDAECNTRVNSAVKVADETKYFARTQIGSCYSNVAILTLDVVKAPKVPTVTIVEGEVITCNETSIVQRGKIKITNYNANYDYIIGDNDNSPVNVAIENDEAYIYFDFGAAAFTLKAKEKTCGLFSEKSAPFEITESDNAPTITGNNSIQPGGSTVLTSDKGANTIWKTSGGKLSATEGASVTFSADANGKYTITAIYNDCETDYVVSVQDDLYVWVRRPIKKETAYDQFYHKNQNSKNAIGGDLFYKEFASLPGDYTQYNQGGKKAEMNCTDKEGYTWYGFVVSKEAIENNYYFTVHAPNDGGEQGDAAKYNGFYTHTYATQLVDMDADLYFVMDETESSSSRGWNINAPVVVRASGDAKFNANNFADFVPLYVKDANICGKEVVSFEWQKSASENGAYTTYKSGKGINNIRTREAGWYRCVVTYAEGKVTATSNAIEVTNTTSGTPATLADFSSKLPVIMVNTNGVGFPSDKNLATKNTDCASGKRYPSLYADDLKEKVTVDVIIKKGNEILYDRKARMNYRGSSSLNFKKKSYAFVSGQDSCVFDKGRHDYVKTKKEKMLNLLGDENYKTSDKDWVLYAATPDPSMMRNRLVFDLYQQMRPNDWGVHSTYVELIVDGEYRGVYVFMDKITANEGRVNITNSDGFIVKFDKTDVVDRVEDKDGDQKTFATTRTGTKENSNGIESYGACIDQRFEIEYPEKEDIEDAGGNWEAFYKKVQQRFEDFETALANKKYEEVRAIIDYDSWADWFIISEFIKNQDGFRASNLFIYNGGKIMATPLWDQELSMDNRTRIAHGSNSENGLLSTTSSVYTDAFPAPFWFTNKGTDVNNLTGGLLNDPCFVALVKSKWDAYQAGVLSASNCSTLVAKYDGELDDAIRSREATKWPYTEAARGTTTDGDYMGYYSQGEGDPSHYYYNVSKNAITSYATKRSTKLDANSGLGKAINNLNGETLIFNIKPATVETSPWQQSVIFVNAPTGYEYILDYSALTAVGAEVKQNGNTYTIKVPRPNIWETAGNGAEKKVTYQISATIDAEGDNACGAQIENTATATINVNDVTEDCNPPIVKP